MTRARAPESASTTASEAGGVTGRQVLVGIIAFFTLIFTVNGFMIYKAMSTFGGLETADAYRRGLDYNRRVAAGEAQARQGWRDDMAFSAQTNGLSFRLADRDGGPVSGLQAAVTIGRPATDRFDLNVALRERAPGLYEADVGALEPGAWVVGFTAARDSGGSPLYESRRRLWVNR
jgi:nitrogen fixation protein FixH